MTLYYITPSDIQVARVDRQCIVKFCEALGKKIDLYLVTIKIRLHESEIEEEDLYKLYGVEKTFDITQLPTFLAQNKRGFISSIIIVVAYSLFSLKFLVLKRDNNVYLYFKNYIYTIPYFLVNLFRTKKLIFVYEIHSLPRSRFKTYLLKRFDKIIANSHALKDDLVKNIPSIKSKILGTHQGVDLKYDQFHGADKYELREKLGLPLDNFLAVYTGKVYYGYKEIDYFIETARILKDSGIEIVVVGGREDHVEKFKKENKDTANIYFVPFVPPTMVYQYQYVADALLIYYPSGISINKYRSPGKLFEYMMAGRPIISADYPVLEEVLENEKSAMFIKKDSPKELAKAMIRLKENQGLGERMAIQAYEKVENYTWDSRANKILSFITNDKKNN